MTFWHCPPSQPCDKTFNAIYLGDVHSDQYIDRYEGIPGSESAHTLTGMTFGGPGKALAGSILDITVTSDQNGDGQLEGENFWGNYDTFKTSEKVPVPIRGTNDIKYVDEFRFDGVSQYQADVVYTDGTTGKALITVIQDDLGRTFMVPNENGTTGGLLPKPIQSVTLGCPVQDCDNDYDYCPPDDPPFIPCFAAGVRLLTEKGQRPVERIRVGDKVETADRGLQTVRWVGARKLDAVDLGAAPNMRPIRIARGALGDRLPRRDIMVSPQHRMLVRSAIAQTMFGTDEVLVAAKHLVGLPGVTVAEDVTEVTYVHLLFDRHEIVFAEGALSESLYTGEQALRAVGAAARAEILTLFPELASGQPAAAARMFLTGRQGRELSVRHGACALQ